MCDRRHTRCCEVPASEPCVQVGLVDACCVRHSPGLELHWAVWSGEWAAPGLMGMSSWRGGEEACAPGSAVGERLQMEEV